MKQTFTLTAILFSAYAYSQTGYATVGTSMILNQGVNNSITLGAGYNSGKNSIGIIADFYGVDKAKGRFLVPALDIRRYAFKRKFSPYVSLQPGYTLYNKTTEGVLTKGSFALAGVTGVNFQPGEVGVSLSVGYQYHSFKTLKHTESVNSFKMNVCILF